MNTLTTPARPAAAASRSKRRWLALGILALAQFLVVLDSSIVNIALPVLGRELSMDTAALTWVITAYVLAFGGLLLLGGRLADRYGHRRIFLIGSAGFVAASALAGSLDLQRDAPRRARVAGSVGRTPRPGRARAAHAPLPRREGTHQGARALGRGRRHRLRRRRAAGRHPHRDPRLAVGVLRQRARRRDRPDRDPPARHAGRHAPGRTSGCSGSRHRDRSTRRARGCIQRRGAARIPAPAAPDPRRGRHRARRPVHRDRTSQRCAARSAGGLPQSQPRARQCEHAAGRRSDGRAVLRPVCLHAVRARLRCPRYRPHTAAARRRSRGRRRRCARCDQPCRRPTRCWQGRCSSWPADWYGSHSRRPTPSS